MKPTPWAVRFERSCRRWQKQLGLTDWTLHFETEPADGATEATVDYDCDCRQVWVTAHNDDRNFDRADRIGLHEMLHILLADFSAAVAARGAVEHPDVRREEHRVIERLLNAIDGVPE